MASNRSRRLLGFGCALLLASLGACSRAGGGEPSRPGTTVEQASQPAATTSAAPVAASTPAPSPTPAASKIGQAKFGTEGGKEVSLYTLTNAHGLVAKITNYGAIITELHVPDRQGKLADVVLGFDNLAGYVEHNPYFGAIVGRVANRIKNAQFELDGKKYKLAANNAPHHLHGGKKGFDKVVWEATPSETPDGPALKLTYVSKDGDEAYPGTLTATVTYTLTNKDELKVDMQATADKVTLVNLAHHSYWNLAGAAAPTVLEHELALYADAYTPGDPVPDGKVKPVKGTPFDFTTAKVIGKDLKEAGGKPVGFDHNFVVRGEPNQLRPVARLKDPKSGRVMTIEADQPGVQFYTGNFLDGTLKGKGASFAQYAGLCLESQKFPNSANVPAWKNDVVLKPGTAYRHTMVHRFTAE